MRDDQLDPPIVPPESGPSTASVDAEKAKTEDPFAVYQTHSFGICFAGFVTSGAGLFNLIIAITMAMNVPPKMPLFRRYCISIIVLYAVMIFCGIFGIVAGIVKNLMLLRLNIALSVLTVFLATAPWVLNFTLNDQKKDILLSTCVETRNSTEGITYWDPLHSYTNSTENDWTVDAAEEWCQSQWGQYSYGDIITLFIIASGPMMYCALVLSHYKGILFYRQREGGGYAHLDEGVEPQAHEWDGSDSEVESTRDLVKVHAQGTINSYELEALHTSDPPQHSTAGHSILHGSGPDGRR